MATTATSYDLDWALYELSRSELRRQRRNLTIELVSSFVLVNLKLALRLAQITFGALIVASLWLRWAVAKINLRLIDNDSKMDARLNGLRRRTTAQGQAIASRKACSSGAIRAWIHSVLFEWRTRIHVFWMFQRAVRRQLRKPSSCGSHAAPPKAKRPVRRYIAIAALVTIFLGVLVPSFNLKAVSELDRRKQKDLEVPAWASSVEQWKDLVRQVSHDPNVVVVRDGTQTNILSEALSNVTNTGITVKTYVRGQERLLYLLILLGSNGDASHQDGLCPLDSLQRRKIVSLITAGGGSADSDVEGKNGARNSLILCGYLINSITDQVVNIEPTGKLRYAKYGANGATVLAYDLARKWVGGSDNSKDAYAATFARLYADWNKAASPTYALRKE